MPLWRYMSKELIVSATSLETKVAVVEEDQVTEIFIERTKSRGILGNIYKGKVTRVLPGMQSAFVDISLERDAFLYVSDFVEDYEEYEKMFSDAEQAAEKLLKVEVKEDHIQPDEPRRRGGRGRGRPGRRGRGERPEHGGARHWEERSPAAEETPQATVAERTAPPEPPVPSPAGAGAPSAGRPEPVSEPAAGRHSSWLDEVREAQAALEREAGKQSTGTRSENQSPRDSRWDEDRDARVRGDREVDQFSLPDEDSAESAPENSSTHSESPKKEHSGAESFQDEATRDSPTAGIGTTVERPTADEF